MTSTGGDHSDDLDGRVGGTEDVRRAYEVMPFAMASVMGPDHVFATSNAAYRTMFARSGIVGRRVLDVFPELAGQQAVEILERVRRTGETVAHTSWRFDLDVGGAGELRPFYFDFFATPVLGADGEVDGVQVTQLDVTERVLGQRDAEQAARDRRRRDTEAAAGVARLQDMLLPTDLPLVPWLDIEARYLLAGGKGSGGDWFDAVVRPDGHVALVVGDVVGHGVRASAVMGQLRAVLHSQLLTRSTLSEALAVLDRYAEREIESRATTVCVLELDAVSGQLEYCTAGHPPPLVVTGAGDAQYLVPTGAGPLASGKGFATRRASLADGDLVVMYTDGLVDRPGRTPAESTVQLREVVRETARNARPRAGTPSRPVARVCETGLELLTRETGYDDDITLLAAQRRRQAAPFSASLDATLATVPAARDAVSDWLLPLGISGVDDLAVRHAVGELVANAVVHANAGEDPPRSHLVEVDAEVDGDGVLACRIHDDGQWVELAASASGGLGLGMVTSMVDHLAIDTQGSGTTATFRHRLTREASLYAPGPGTTVGGAGRGASLSVEADESVLRLSGAVDAQGAERLRVALHSAGRGGTAEVTVDLTDVTYLGSSGVRVLAEALRDESRVRLVAPPGSIAHHVLGVVQLG